MEALWPEILQKWLDQRGWGVSHFSRETEIPRRTVRSWLQEGSIPSLKWRGKLQEVTGIVIAEEMVPQKTGVEEVSLVTAEAIYQLVRPVGPIILFFVQHSHQAERKYLRKLLGNSLEDLLDGVQGLYSEKAREKVLENRANMRARKTGKEKIRSD